MGKKEAAQKARDIREKHKGDLEVVHVELDNLLIKVLRAKGYHELCDEFDAQEMWYA